MKNDHVQITERLIAKHGLEGASEVAIDAVLKAQDTGDNYALSVWREVRQLLTQRLNEMD
jgi:hypothetical protein